MNHRASIVEETSMMGKPKQGVEVQPGYKDANRQTSNLRQRWEWTEETIWNKKMLAALENGVKGGVWFSLIDKVYSLSTLEKAWIYVKRNKGAAGVDNMDVDKFEYAKDVYIHEIHKQLKEGTYRPQAVKRVYIPKGKGKFRPLGIPIVKDRIVQAAIKLVIEPIFENVFVESSFGFRPGRGCKDALRQVDNLIKGGNVWYADADLQAYFDTISHQRLMQKFKCYISDGALCKLIESFLKHEIMENGEIKRATAGTPQGGVLSPLLSNLYLHDLDVLLSENGFNMVRYADDFVVLANNKETVLHAERIIQQWAQENELIIHPEKSHIGNCMVKGEGFDFLGYRFEGGTKWVSDKSLKKYRDNIRSKTRRTSGESIEATIKKLNPVLRGWYNYFKHVTLYTMGTFDSFVRRRLRAILRKQNKRPGYGCNYQDHKQWPNAYFAKLGVFTMEENRQREIACRSRC
jgi:RNA-directed DNA polymerase